MKLSEIFFSLSLLSSEYMSQYNNIQYSPPIFYNIKNKDAQNGAVTLKFVFFKPTLSAP